MPELRVDPTALENLAGELLRVRSTLSATKRATSVSDDIAGSPLLADRLDSFFDHWERGLRDLDEGLAKVAPALTEAARAYRETEQAVAAGATVTP